MQRGSAFKSVRDHAAIGCKAVYRLYAPLAQNRRSDSIVNRPGGGEKLESGMFRIPHPWIWRINKTRFFMSGKCTHTCTAMNAHWGWPHYWLGRTRTRSLPPLDVMDESIDLSIYEWIGVRRLYIYEDHNSVRVIAWLFFTRCERTIRTVPCTLYT